MLAAWEFNRTFAPLDGVDYAWVVDLAEKKYDLAADTYRRLDDKAAAVVTYLGGVSGLITAGVVTAAATARLHLWVTAAFLPAFLAAAVAVVLAANARRPRTLYHPPAIDGLVRDAHHAAAYGVMNARDTSLARWHMAVEGTILAAEGKGRLVCDATRWMAYTLISLGLPLVVVVGRLALGLPIAYPAHG